MPSQPTTGHIQLNTEDDPNFWVPDDPDDISIPKTTKKLSRSDHLPADQSVSDAISSDLFRESQRLRDELEANMKAEEERKRKEEEERIPLELTRIEKTVHFQNLDQWEDELYSDDGTDEDSTTDSKTKEDEDSAKEKIGYYDDNGESERIVVEYEETASIQGGPNAQYSEYSISTQKPENQSVPEKPEEAEPFNEAQLMEHLLEESDSSTSKKDSIEISRGSQDLAESRKLGEKKKRKKKAHYTDDGGYDLQYAMEDVVEFLRSEKTSKTAQLRNSLLIDVDHEKDGSYVMVDGNNNTDSQQAKEFAEEEEEELFRRALLEPPTCNIYLNTETIQQGTSAASPNFAYRSLAGMPDGGTRQSTSSISTRSLASKPLTSRPAFKETPRRLSEMSTKSDTYLLVRILRR